MVPYASKLPCGVLVSGAKAGDFKLHIGPLAVSPGAAQNSARSRPTSGYGSCTLHFHFTRAIQGDYCCSLSGYPTPPILNPNPQTLCIPTIPII